MKPIIFCTTAILTTLVTAAPPPSIDQCHHDTGITGPPNTLPNWEKREHTLEKCLSKCDWVTPWKRIWSSRLVPSVRAMCKRKCNKKYAGKGNDTKNHSKDGRKGGERTTEQNEPVVEEVIVVHDHQGSKSADSEVFVETAQPSFELENTNQTAIDEADEAGNDETSDSNIPVGLANLQKRDLCYAKCKKNCKLKGFLWHWVFWPWRFGRCKKVCNEKCNTGDEKVEQDDLVIEEVITVHEHDKPTKTTGPEKGKPMNEPVVTEVTYVHEHDGDKNVNSKGVADRSQDGPETDGSENIKASKANIDEAGTADMDG